MGKARAGAVVVGGERGAGFGASRGPPARGVARQFTHFCATQFRFGLSTFAVAAAGGDGASGAGCVCAKDEAGGEQDRGEECEPKKGAAEDGVEWKARNHVSSLRGAEQKTTGAVGLVGFVT